MKYKDPSDGNMKDVDALVINGDNVDGGSDGFSPITKVEQTEDGAIISITDKNGTTTATVKNGEDGEDGIGIESVVQTTTSDEDSGENIVTVTLSNGQTEAFSVKNGSKGSQGEQGVSGVYVGSGEMPEGYNIQIDPNGEADEFVTKEELEEAVVQSVEKYLEKNPIESNVTEVEKGQWNGYQAQIDELDREKAFRSEIPHKTSDLENDSGHITNNTQGLLYYYKKTEIDSMFGAYVDDVAELIDENLALLGGVGNE